MRSKTLASDEALLSDPRLAEHWVKKDWNTIERLSAFSPGTKQIAILSYPDDEGVRLNSGRSGATEGPERILHYLGRMVNRGTKTPPILVVSDSIKSPYLEKRHQEAEKRVIHLLNLNCRVITLGGGHDYGFPDASAYLQKTKGKVLNIDAHLDMRPVVEGRFNSGTAFFRLIKKFGGKPLTAWGIQEHCNAISHLAFGKSSGAKILGAQDKLPKISGPLGISVCLDAFAGIRGVSAPSTVGLTTNQGVEAIDSLKKNSKWLGLYECAPKFDPLNEDSARFAALLAYKFIHIL